MSIAVLKRKGTRLEAQLQGPAERWLLKGGFIPLREFKTPWGISDVVGIKPNLEKVFMRTSMRHTDSLGDVGSVMVLLKVPTLTSRRSVTMDDLIGELGDIIGDVEVTQNVQRLIRKGFLTQTSAGRYMRNTPWLPYHDELISIELKLDRIDEALKQAKRHKTITSSSFVAFPDIIARRVIESGRKDEFIAAGIGMLAIDGENCCEVLTPSLSTDGTERVYEIAAADRCWRRVLETIQH